MNTLTDLRRTLDQHADDVADPTAVVRTAAVHHRVAVARRRRRTVGTGVVAGVLVAVAAVVVWPRVSSDPVPAAPVLLGEKAPTTQQVTRLHLPHRRKRDLVPPVRDRRRTEVRPAAALLVDHQLQHADRDQPPGQRGVALRRVPLPGLRRGAPGDLRRDEDLGRARQRRRRVVPADRCHPGRGLQQGRDHVPARRGRHLTGAWPRHRRGSDGRHVLVRRAQRTCRPAPGVLGDPAR